METNIVYHLDFLKNNLPDKCANLIIADPPYFEVKGEFDFVWEKFEHYLEDVERWAKEFKRILADNGTLIFYGDSKKIAYCQIILDKYFELLSNSVVHVYDRQTNKIRIEDARSFINTTERFLMYGNEYSENIRDYIRNEILKSKGKISFKELNSVFGTATNGGGVASACFSLNKKDPQPITKEMYLKLQVYCKPHLTKSFDEISRYFSPIEQYKMDVLKFSQEGHKTGKFDHDTVKPEKLTRVLITTCSRPGDLVVVPFAGSGTECEMSIVEGREFVGFDILKKYVDMANNRCNSRKSNPQIQF